MRVNCKNCGNEFDARPADIKRGWGKFCSKSCKATKQEQKTGQYRRYQNRQQADNNDTSYSLYDLYDKDY